jgi:hypothetical protein
MNSSHFKEKLIITEKDSAILDEINQDRDLLRDGIVREALIVSMRIWLPDDISEGVIDICFPVDGEDNLHGFKDIFEAKVSKDSLGVYRLSNRDRGKDIPSHFFSIIEQKLLISVSMGVIVPYHGHIYGKGIYCKVADLKAKEMRWVLEDIEIISPYENENIVWRKTDESLPKKYNKKNYN